MSCEVIANIHWALTMSLFEKKEESGEIEFSNTPVLLSSSRSSSVLMAEPEPDLPFVKSCKDKPPNPDALLGNEGELENPRGHPNMYHPGYSPTLWALLAHWGDHFYGQRGVIEGYGHGGDMVILMGWSVGWWRRD